LKNIIAAREKVAKKIEENKKAEEQKLEKHKRIVMERLVKEKEKREESKQQKIILQEFMKKPEIITELVQYRKQLRHVFRYFSRLDSLEITHDLNKAINTLDLPKFSKLCINFKLVPYLISSEDAVFLFKNTLKFKSNFTNEVGKSSQTIEFEDFEEILIRLGLLVRNRLDETGFIIEGELNRVYDTNSADEKIIQNLLKFMKIYLDDNKITLDNKLNSMRMEAKKTFVRKPQNSIGQNTRKLLNLTVDNQNANISPENKQNISQDIIKPEDVPAQPDQSALAIVTDVIDMAQPPQQNSDQIIQPTAQAKNPIIPENKNEPLQNQIPGNNPNLPKNTNDVPISAMPLSGDSSLILSKPIEKSQLQDSANKVPTEEKKN